MDENTDKPQKRITLSHAIYRGERCIAIAFPYDPQLITVAKATGAHWSADKRCWLTPNDPEQLKSIFQACKGQHGRTRRHSLRNLLIQRVRALGQNDQARPDPSVHLERV